MSLFEHITEEKGKERKGMLEHQVRYVPVSRVHRGDPFTTLKSA
jgi:hypothetical protein